MLMIGKNLWQEQPKSRQDAVCEKKGMAGDHTLSTYRFECLNCTYSDSNCSKVNNLPQTA